MKRFAFAAAALILLSGCAPSYPGGNLPEAVRKLFRKEMKVEAESRLVGKTLYVTFDVENTVTSGFELPEDVSKKLEDAMLSISRIALSTDAKVHFTVIEARDPIWGVETILIRRTQDIKDLFFWKISKGDFDERLILETRKIEPESEKDEDWHDILLPEFMSRLVASRFSRGSRANPFLSVLFGIDKMTADYDGDTKTLTFNVESKPDLLAAQDSTSSVTSELLKGSILEQVARVEKKYKDDFTGGNVWASGIAVKKLNGDILFRASREEWLSIDRNKKRRSQAQFNKGGTMPIPLDAMLSLVVAAIGLLTVVTAFQIAEPRKRMIAYVIAGIVTFFGLYNYIGSELRGYRMRQKISELQHSQQMNFGEIQKRLQETQAAQPAQSAPKRTGK